MPVDENKAHRLQVRLTEQEMLNLDSIAKRLDMSRTDVIRLFLNISVAYNMPSSREDIPSYIIFDTGKADSLLRENLAQGRNINQLVRAFQTAVFNREEINAHELEDFRKSIQSLRRKYDDVFAAVKELDESAHVGV